MPSNTLFSINFPRAYQQLSLQAVFRHIPDDFQVEEILGFELAGEGEHIALLLEKCGHNTHWVAARLANYMGIQQSDVSYCGRKDRQAITTQWFSLYDAQRKPIDWSAFSEEGIKIIQCTRHNKKLRPGMHQYNRFSIRLRGVAGVDKQSLSDEDKQQTLTEINYLFSQGVPNYFGPQRFGHNANNLSLANDWLVHNKAPPRKQRSIILSAARAYLFNRVLAHRVQGSNWRQPLAGDVIEEGIITGPLWGRGRLATTVAAQTLEQTVLENYAAWCHQLEHMGLKQERRPLLLIPKDTHCQWQQDDLLLAFKLNAGEFATAILAEIAELNCSTTQGVNSQ